MSRIVLGSILWMLISHISWAQSYVSVHVEKDTVSIGEVFTAKLEANGIVQFDSIDNLTWQLTDIKNELFTSDTNLYEKFADLEIVDAGNFAKFYSDGKFSIPKDQLQFSKNYWHTYIKLVAYSPGVFRLPAPRLVSAKPFENLQLKDYFIYVKVPDSIDIAQLDNIADSKDIIDVKSSPWSYIKYLIGTLLLSILMWYFYKIFKKRNIKKTPIPISEEFKEVIPAHIKALKALEALETKQLWQNGLIKEYQSELTFIIRTYLSERYDIDALEVTTSELLNNALLNWNDVVLKNKLQRLLMISDIVKFAKGSPDVDMYPSFMSDALLIVNNTKSEKA